MNIRKNIDYVEMHAAIDKAITRNLSQMELYAAIGKAVSARSEKGAAVAAAEYLSANYPDARGFSPRNLRRMREFYRTYEAALSVLALAMQVGWTQNVVVLEADLTMEERQWYLKAVLQFGWTKLELLDKIENRVYEELVLDNGQEICDNDKNGDEEKTKSHYEGCKLFVPSIQTENFPAAMQGKIKEGSGTMAHYVVADVHGEADRLHAMLEKIQFSDEDTLYIIGDVIDRGPDGIKLLLEIMHTPNMVMLLGNHEYMMMQYLAPGASGVNIRRWNKNGNAPTLAAYLQLSAEEQQEILYFLRTRPTHLEVTVNGQNFYLVHAWPADNVHDEVWLRPEIDAPNPKPGYLVIIGHTKVLSLIQPEEARIAYAMDLEDREDNLRILHTPGFIDIDCGCGYEMPIKALSCIQLEDMLESYIDE